ncbi:hypothetical protein NUU61_004484 [Penicillium alfredii]|uniref:Uncharacterized protein n=1 Tax=Penicillium alfredii TaxID=1506179 RepID=A0A9W9FLN7_9EURO|nr:uncharacterized protein NUU61_004484 [Penicillium alfredii]KAJ5102262.1 hypothetical protein NUU61_004484 [Penicillium alfredii]
MAPVVPPQMRFLNDAAQSLSLSPSTSAHLLATHTLLLHQDSKALTVRQQKDYCGACGSIRDPQSTKVTQIRRGKSLPSQSSRPGPGATVYKCLRCHRRAVTPRKQRLSKTTSRITSHAATAKPSPTPISQQSTPSEVAKSTTDAPTPKEPPSKTAENASSKKRAKTRKQGGLQALLASKQRSSPSLDLLDFLQ